MHRVLLAAGGTGEEAAGCMPAGWPWIPERDWSASSLSLSILDLGQLP